MQQYHFPSGPAPGTVPSTLDTQVIWVQLGEAVKSKKDGEAVVAKLSVHFRNRFLSSPQTREQDWLTPQLST
jgi:hypothetical protein